MFSKHHMGKKKKWVFRGDNSFEEIALDLNSTMSFELNDLLEIFPKS